MSSVLERQGFHALLHANGDGTFSLDTHDIGGGAGVADNSVEIQGFRMQLHDNGDGTFSICTTTSTGASDQVIEFEGFLLKIHPTGETDPVSQSPRYAFVVNSV